MVNWSGSRHCCSCADDGQGTKAARHPNKGGERGKPPHLRPQHGARAQHEAVAGHRHVAGGVRRGSLSSRGINTAVFGRASCTLDGAFCRLWRGRSGAAGAQHDVDIAVCRVAKSVRDRARQRGAHGPGCQRSFGVVGVVCRHDKGRWLLLSVCMVIMRLELAHVKRSRDARSVPRQNADERSTSCICAPMAWNQYVCRLWSCFNIELCSQAAGGGDGLAERARVWCAASRRRAARRAR